MKDIIVAKLKEKLTQLRNERRNIQDEVSEKTIGYILAGLGVVAGLAWNEAINALINYLFPLSRNGVLAKFFYAVLMTIFIVVLSSYLLRIRGRKDQ